MNIEVFVLDVGLDGDNLVVSVNEDGVEMVVFDFVVINNIINGNWCLVVVDLILWYGKSIFLSWVFDIKDGEFNFEGLVNGFFIGVVLDDVQILIICAEVNKFCTFVIVDMCVINDFCVVFMCVVFVKKIDLFNEFEFGFCFYVDVVGCEACSVLDECVNLLEEGGLFDL